jgi:hypothetical protein
MFRIIFVSIAIMSNLCVASELLEKHGFYPGSIAEVTATEELEEVAQELQQAKLRLRQRSAQQQSLSAAGEAITIATQSVSFIFGADNKQVTISVPYDSIWKPQKVNGQIQQDTDRTIFYYAIPTPYNEFALGLFKVLIGKKNLNEVSSFWSGLFNKKFAKEDFQKFYALSAEQQSEVRSGLLSLIYGAHAGDDFFKEFPFDLHIIQFSYNGLPVDYAIILNHQAKEFKAIQQMLDDLNNPRLVPLLLGDEVDTKLVAKNFRLLLEYVSIAQKSVEDLEKVSTKLGITTLDDQKREQCVAKGFYIYKDMPLHAVQQSIILAQQYDLQALYLQSLTDIYADKLMDYPFSSQDELLKLLPISLDMDKLTVQRIVYNLLRKKYKFLRDEEQQKLLYRYNILWPGILMGDPISYALHKYSPYPCLFMRTTMQSTVIGGMTQEQISSDFMPYISRVCNTLNKDILDIEIIDNKSALAIDKDGLLLLSITFMNHMMLGDRYDFSLKNNSEGKIILLPSNKACAGFRGHIALCSIKNNKITNVEIYKISDSGSEYVSDLFVLGNIIAISYEHSSGEYDCCFFDIKKQRLILDPNERPDNVIEIDFYKSNSDQLFKKKFVLLHNADFCINRSLIMKARQFTKVYDCYDVLLDDVQENIYIAYESSVNEGVQSVTRKYKIIPSDLKSVINAINSTEKALRGKAQRRHLTLDLLYFMAHKYPDMVKAPDNIKKSENLVSAPMKAILQPTLSNKAKSAYFSWSDVFKRQLKWAAGIAAGVGLTGIAAYFANKAGYSISSLYTPQSSTAYGKLKIPQGLQ